MAEAVVKFFVQRLESLALHEGQTFTGLEDQIERLKSSLKEIGSFLGDKSAADGDAAFSSWANELRDLVHEMEDHVDEFIIEMDQKHRESGRSELTDCFKADLQKIESRLAETIHRMAEIKNSTKFEGGKQTCEEGETENYNSIIAEEEEGNEGSKELFQSKEEDQPEISATTMEGEECDIKQEGQMSSSSSSVQFRQKYANLPYYLQSCLMYCCLFPENYWINRGRLIRLLVAEGLVQEKDGEIWEDVAEENITELVSQGMLQVVDQHHGDGTKFIVSSSYFMILRENFTTSHASSDSTIPRTARRVLTPDMTRVAQDLSDLRPRSLFLFGKQEQLEGNWLNFMGAKFLRVLDLQDTKIKSLPEEVGDLIHLTYLGLKQTHISELPARIGNLRALQTLDIRWCGYLTTLLNEVLNLVRLRHLKMFKNIGVAGMKLPEGIVKFENLLTLTGVYAGGSIARELGELRQLRRLGLMDVSEENVNELFDSIMKMQGLVSLSLEAKETRNHEYLVLLDSFSPPPLLRKLRLEGRLAKTPNWLGSMENLTKLRLGFSHLPDNPTTVLQLLPNLKKLTLWQAFDSRKLGKEFCKPGGFPKLQVLTIASGVLEEWTELEEGALPSLQYLHLHNCLRLQMLPEGLQFITTMKQLDILPLLKDHAERLKPDGGEENYKIRNIPSVRFIPMSVLS